MYFIPVPDIVNDKKFVVHCIASGGCERILFGNLPLKRSK